MVSQEGRQGEEATGVEGHGAAQVGIWCRTGRNMVQGWFAEEESKRGLWMGAQHIVGSV